MNRNKVSHRDHDRNRRIPIYRDVVRGSGGIAGGKFLFVNDAAGITDIVDSGTAQSASAGAIVLASTASSTDDAYVGMSCQITGGTGSGQDHQRGTAYNGTTKELTVSGAWTTTPDSTSTYRIVNRGY